jgi:hypothetical protein
MSLGAEEGAARRQYQADYCSVHVIWALPQVIVRVLRGCLI